MKNKPKEGFKFANFRYDDELICEYLNQILTDGNTDELLEALEEITKTKDMKEISQKTTLERESLYESLKKGAKPRFETIIKTLKSLNLSLKINKN